MIAPLLAMVLALSPTDLEHQAGSQIVREYERIGRSAPAYDPALSQAARSLARDALVSSAADAADVLAITERVSQAGAADPTPRAIVVRASPVDYALETFLKRGDLSGEPATAVGVGAAVDGDRAVIVALLSDRKGSLQPFPHQLPKAGSTHGLCGELQSPLAHAEVYATQPSGSVERVPLTREAGPHFCAQITFPTQGRYTLEVVGRGPRGPEVTSLFFVEVGPHRASDPRFALVEPRDVPQARSAILARVNALRAAQHLGVLTLDPKASDIAQAYADRMAKENFFAHVSPDGSDLRRRLTSAGYAYERAGENLGYASGPLAAHFAIEHSPGHRRNLLEPDFQALGVGVAPVHQGDQTQSIVVEVLTRPVHASNQPLVDAYRSLAQRRSARHLPPLERSEVLEQIAMAHARRALALDSPKAKLPSGSVHDQVFAALRDVKTASVDIFVADEASALPESRSIADAHNDQVGIGAVKGDSRTYGRDKYWVVVIYTSRGQSR